MGVSRTAFSSVRPGPHTLEGMRDKPWPVWPPGSRKLTPETASLIRDEAVGMHKPVQRLAEEFGVKVEIIQRVLNRTLHGDSR